MTILIIIVILAIIFILYKSSKLRECPRCLDTGGYAPCGNDYCRECCEKCYASNYGCEYFEKKSRERSKFDGQEWD